ncbi:MAG: heparinase II/III family protein [Candidatus Hydrogenedentes bacterium]|nr:heparinase II/III family protein [Candidatus Hydrogenedentota bacterium]
MMWLAAIALTGAVQWQHPAGMVTDDTVAEVRQKVAEHDWAKRLYDARKHTLDEWVNAPLDDLRRVFPKKRGNVYHNFSCPDDRSRLKFDPFHSDSFQCPVCGKTYAPETDAGIYKPDDRYHGTMYDGWACTFFQTACDVAADLALVARVDDNAAYRVRAIDILMLYADVTENMPTDVNKEPQFSRIYTYHREGDNKVLFDLAIAYELSRDHMAPEQRARVETVVLKRILNDIMMEPIYTYDHNNVYQWHRTILQTALALEREDLIDWSFGYGAFDPEHQPEHRSLRRIVATHFKPDGAFWELCSGYHLYPMFHFCELAVLSHHLSAMDSQRFPAAQYDFTDRSSAGGQAIKNALEWFVSMAMPDRTMPTMGDSTVSRAGMDDYMVTAEIGYRYFDVRAVGDYPALREGKRSWPGLVHGAPEIVQRYTPCTSSFLSSGWVSLRSDWQGNRTWVGLNSLIPGGGHQHADRLTFVNYSHGKLLALEKATPYNESVTRVLGTLSQSHNTVTVDKTSQKQGEALTEAETPKVTQFYAGPVVQFAEVNGDHLYPQANIYRRSVALFEDVAVDLFQVSGGATHDWMVHHAGKAPEFSVPVSDGEFSPADWLYNGTKRVRHARTDDTWQASWRVDDVTSRVTMLGAAATGVYALETYPVDNAIVTPKDPPCQSLCVRRESNAPFLAVWNSWQKEPNVSKISRGSSPQSLMVTTTSNTYRLLFGPGETTFDDGVSIKTDAVFTLVRNRDAVVYARGTRVDLAAPEGSLQIASDRPATVSAEFLRGDVTLETSGDIMYDTYGGADTYRDAPGAIVTVDGALWRVHKTRLRFAGHVEPAKQLSNAGSR